MIDIEKTLEDLKLLNTLCHGTVLDDALALLKEQDETINDLTDTIRQLNQHIKDLSEYMTPYGMVKDVKAYVEQLKEQEAVEPKTGHWIWLQLCANEGVYCSECHTKMFDRYPMKKKLSLFCGHCGAKMGDEAESR